MNAINLRKCSGHVYTGVEQAVCIKLTVVTSVWLYRWASNSCTAAAELPALPMSTITGDAGVRDEEQPNCSNSQRTLLWAITMWLWALKL